MSAPEPLLDVRDLRVRGPREPDGEAPLLLDGVSFTLRRGEIFGLIGETGAGKSLTGWSILGLLDPALGVEGGEVFFEGEDLLALAPRAMRRRRGRDLAVVVQDPASALDPLRKLGTQLANMHRVHSDGSRAHARERAREVLEATRLPERALTAYPHELSGGMAQRAVLAMALVNRAPLLIADEPTTGLDVTVQAEILELLVELVAREQMSVLMITHDLGVVANYCQRVAVMYAGKIVEQASVEALFAGPEHPYTQLLLRASEGHAALPDAHASPLEAAGEWSSRCRFSDRCPRVAEQCRSAPPPLRRSEPDRQLLCHQPWLSA